VIKCYYGSEFDATGYLDKFYDLRIALPEIDYSSYLSKYFYAVDDWGYGSVCLDVIKHFRFSLRETERFIRLVKIAKPKYADDLSTSSPSQNATIFAIMYVVPVMIGLSMKDLTQYEKFIRGEDFKPLFEILKNYCSTPSFLNKLLFTSTESSSDEDTKTLLKDRLNEAYKAIFSDILKEQGISNMLITKDTRNKIFEIASLLSFNANYDFE
jgi:hypothetical protein